MRLRATHTFVVDLALPEPLMPLETIARNLFWTWNTDARALFERIDEANWEASAHNPLRVLQLATPAALEHLAADDGFKLHLARVNDAMRGYLARRERMTVPETSSRDVIAYFSLEFALTESLPNYSGGLGVLAGDHLKSASDLGLPLVGVGLLYSEGYFQQVLGPDGWQQEEYTVLDLASQPLTRVLDDAGRAVAISVPFEGRDVHAAVWRLDVGQTPLILLDSNVGENSEADRKISSRLYGGDFELRIQQEMLLGIGGIRALAALGLRPAVCHMNEGHSALLGLERIRMLMEESGASFAEARLPVSASTVFTTHTAVAAGIDLFPPEFVERHLASYYTQMGLDSPTFIGLGRTNPDDGNEPFSMALLGLRLSGFRNGVSKLHGVVARKLWEAAWPNIPETQVPIDAITNGVHLPTWVSHEMSELFDRYVGPRWRDDPVESERWNQIRSAPDGELWGVHERQRHKLVRRTREQSRDSAAARGLSSWDASIGAPLDENALTIGFARRFAGYKRATLLFRDPERLAAILNRAGQPVQFVFAGKAHPRDEPAKQLIREVLQYSQRAEFRDHMVMLERYDVDLARTLVQGCDVWLNTPLRPLEASGTSGMKAVANGALHCSVLDGWWHEAYVPGTGWRIGRDRVDDDPEVQDAFDAESLYDLLEHEIVDAFYTRDADGVPQAWVARMKASISTYAPRFNTSRMVAEYAARAYAPAAAVWRHLTEDRMSRARSQAEWLTRVVAAWPSLRVTQVGQQTASNVGVGDPVTVIARAQLGPLTPDDVRLDVLFGRATATNELLGESCVQLAPLGQAEDGNWTFSGTFWPKEGGRSGYVVRLLPEHPDLRDAFAPGLALWA
jgi:glycogen phosphorylase